MILYTIYSIYDTIILFDFLYTAFYGKNATAFTLKKS